MAKAKSLVDRLRSAAVLKMSFVLRGGLESPAFTHVYPGVLRDLELTEGEVDAYIEAHRAEVERQARGAVDGGDSPEE